MKSKIFFLLILFYNFNFQVINCLVWFQVIDGWRPGAVSKRLLHMLKKAKSMKSTERNVKTTKRTKKQAEEKPTLKISKRDGVYCIELQATESSKEPNTANTPLVYKVESETNKARKKKKDRIQRRLIKNAVTNVWPKTFEAANCDDICLKALKESVGILSFDETDVFVRGDELKNNDSCSCEDDEVSSSCTSSDVDWEIGFTPPLIRYQESQKNTTEMSVM